MSPIAARRAVRSGGIPLPRRRICRPDWLPAGTFTRRGRRRSSAPRSRRPAPPSAIETGTRQDRSDAVALEDRVLAHLDEDVEIARRAAAQPGLALAGQPDAGAGLDARGDVDRQRRSFSTRPAPCADLAGVLDDLAGAAAGRAGPLDGEEALLRADLAHAGAGRAGLRLGRRPRRRCRCRCSQLTEVGHADGLLAGRRRPLPARRAGCSAGRTRACARPPAAAAAAPPMMSPNRSSNTSEKAEAKSPLAADSAPPPRPPPMPPSKAAWPKRS